jgi:hypothetical protein
MSGDMWMIFGLGVIIGIAGTILGLWFLLKYIDTVP